jgi:hypothetical protein
LIEFILGAFLYAKYKKKYNLKSIFNSWQIYLPLFFALLYVYLEINIWMENYWFLEYQQAFKTATLLSYVPLCIKYKLFENNNIKYKNNELLKMLSSPMMKASLCLFVGSMLNRIAIWSNNGYMMSFPSNTYWTGYIKPEAYYDGLHIIGNAYTALIPLCNTIDIYFSILSPGDILCRFYVFIILYYSIKKSNKI